MNALFPSENKRHACTLAPYYVDSETFHFFVQKRSAEQAQPHALGLFGGGIEKGETLEKALKREIREELGIEISGYQLFSRYEFPKFINNVFTLKTLPDFADSVTIGEGEWGKFMSLEEIIQNPKTLSATRLILSHIAEFIEPA